MNIQEIYELGLAQKWSEADAYQMALIAWAESKGDPNEFYNEPSDGSTSYGIWQINSIHLPKLIEAGIILSVADLADPIVNAQAAYYVGHHQDKTVGSTLYEMYKDKFDWTRWGTVGLPLEDENHPSQFESLLPAPEGVATDWGSLEGVPEVATGEVPEGTLDYRQILKDWFPGLTDLSSEEFEPIYENALTIIERMAGQDEGFTGLDYLQNLQSSGLSWSGAAVGKMFTDKIAEIDDILGEGEVEAPDAGEAAVLPEVEAIVGAIGAAGDAEGGQGPSGAAEGGSAFGWDPEEWIPTPEFDEAVRASPEWAKRIQEWGFGEVQQDWLMSLLYYRFVAGWGPDEANVEEGRANWTPGGTISDFLGGVPPGVDLDDPATYPDDWYPSDGADLFIYDEVQTLFNTNLFKPGAVGDDYTPTGSDIPSGWFTLWAEDNQTVGDWLDSWVDRFNRNAEATGGPDDPKYPVADLVIDFWDHPTDGLKNQDWWTAKTNNFTSMLQMWYTGGGPGTLTGGDVALPVDPRGGLWAPGGSWLDTYAQLQDPTGWGGTGNWGKIWADSINVIRSVAETLGITDALSDNVVNQIAFQLMAGGGAAAHLDPQSAGNWPTQAQQTVEQILLGKLERGEFEKPLGVGTIKELETEFTNRAAIQLITLAPGEALAWAIGVKGEQEGELNKSQVLATIDQRAYAQWGLTVEQQEQLAVGVPGGTSATISDMVNPLWTRAVSVWGDTSYRKDDPWLMDNYQVTNDDGSRRFRTAAEMGDLARTNMARSQYGSEYQDPMNDFLVGAAQMFRSDF